jgi:hypothetical protein
MGVETKFYIDNNGNYIGGFSEGNPAIPVGVIEVEAPPAHGWQKYSDGVWLPLTPEQEAIINA